MYQNVLSQRLSIIKFPWVKGTLRTRTGLVFSPFSHLTQLVAQENLIIKSSSNLIDLISPVSPTHCHFPVLITVNNSMNHSSLQSCVTHYLSQKVRLLRHWGVLNFKRNNNMKQPIQPCTACPASQ